VDFVRALARAGATRGWRFFLLGAEPGVAEAAGLALCREYPGLQVAGTLAGSPDVAMDPVTVGAVRGSRADILLVAYGAPALHLHTEYSKDSMSRLADVAARARMAGLTHLAVTDHNTIEGARRMQDVSSLPVIVGEEIMTAEGELIGLFLKEPVPPGMSASDTVRAIRQQGGLVYLPHPRDPYRHGLSAAGLAQVRDEVDIIEVFNSRCLRPSSNAEALALSASMRAARSAASDAHTLREIGR